MGKVFFFVAVWIGFLAQLGANGIDLNDTKSWKWTHDGSVDVDLYKLMNKIQHDPSILCKERLKSDLARLDRLLESFGQNPTDTLAAKIDLQAEKLQVRYAYIKNNGCFDPGMFLEEENFLPRRKLRSESVVDSPILTNLYKLLDRYLMLRQKGGWDPIEIEDTLYLKVGQEYDEVPAIKRRLALEGFFMGEVNDSRLYTKELADAIKEFQRRHGLKPDGVIGPMTLGMLNTSVDEKIKKILLSIERARWFLRGEDFFVFVNIPGYFLEVYDCNESCLRSDVIVGRKKRPTPLMRNQISYAVLNPYWRAPKTIIKEDILPKLQAGQFDKVRKSGIIASLDPMGRQVVRYEDVEWKFFTEEDLPFYFLQLPGPKNFLGFIKFMFPNKFDVYLHDTSSRQLFKYDYRALSSGCVRVKRPVELYRVLLKRYGRDISYRDIFEQFWAQKTKKVNLRPNIPVYLLYLTAYMDQKGKPYFYNDIYEIDKKMWEYARIEGK